MRHEKVINLSFNELSAWQNYLDGEGDNNLTTVKTFTGDFGPKAEGDITVDIKVCNGEGSPFVDAVLFQDGYEVGCLDVRDTLAGTYEFQSFLKDTFVVVIPDAIEAAKEGQKKYRTIEKWLGTLDVDALVKIEEELREDTPNVSDLIEMILEKCNYEDSTLDVLYERATLKFHASGPQAFTSG